MAISGTASANGKSEAATKALTEVLVPLFADPTGDWSQVVDPGKLAAARYRDESASFAAQGELANPPYAAASVTLSKSYDAVARSMDDFVNVAESYSTDKSDANLANLKAARADLNTAFADNKEARTLAGKLADDTSLICN